MYFRIIVKKNGSFLFRTSKIATAPLASAIYDSITAGFNGAPGEHSVEILQVDGLPVGSIITYEALQTAAAQPGDNDDPA